VGSLIPQPVLVYIPGFWHEALTSSLILGPVTRLYTSFPAWSFGGFFDTTRTSIYIPRVVAFYLPNSCFIMLGCSSRFEANHVS
jgi:hypothetical protein